MKDKICITLGKNIKKYRKLRGLTQEKMAELLEISQATLSKIETCERRLDIIELRQFCRVLNIPFVDFITEIQYL